MKSPGKVETEAMTIANRHILICNNGKKIPSSTASHVSPPGRKRIPYLYAHGIVSEWRAEICEVS
jgi:hypothetical protein